ncbi:MAG TPA: hypothetical protein VLH37_03360, partial [Bacteroidales bacterium]|nr:hypothetical protein [Bacteroidales bacterium]
MNATKNCLINACGGAKFFIWKALFVYLLSVSVSASGQGLSERILPVRAETYRIGIVSFFHETCTFCPEPATLADWLATGQPTDR